MCHAVRAASACIERELAQTAGLVGQRAAEKPSKTNPNQLPSMPPKKASPLLPPYSSFVRMVRRTSVFAGCSCGDKSGHGDFRVRGIGGIFPILPEEARQLNSFGFFDSLESSSLRYVALCSTLR